METEAKESEKLFQSSLQKRFLSPVGGFEYQGFTFSGSEVEEKDIQSSSSGARDFLELRACGDALETTKLDSDYGLESFVRGLWAN